MWYAVMFNKDDQDWGYGSHDLDDAKQMCEDMLEDYPEAYITIIKDDSDPICIGEIHPEDF